MGAGNALVSVVEKGTGTDLGVPSLLVCLVVCLKNKLQYCTIYYYFLFVNCFIYCRVGMAPMVMYIINEK